MRQLVRAIVSPVAGEMSSEDEHKAQQKRKELVRVRVNKHLPYAVSVVPCNLDPHRQDARNSCRAPDATEYRAGALEDQNQAGASALVIPNHTPISM